MISDKWRKAKVRIITHWDISRKPWRCIGYEAMARLYGKDSVEFIGGGRCGTETEARAALDLRLSDQLPLLVTDGAAR